MAILMKAGDTAPMVRVTLLDEQGAPVDLLGASVRFVMATASEPRTVAVDQEATNAQNTDGSDGSKGRVEYAWGEGDTETPGAYVAEFEVTYASGEVQTFPTEDYVDVTIYDDLGGTV